MEKVEPADITFTWLEVLADIADGTDYDNFKDAVAEHQGAGGREYVHSLHEVWKLMHPLQQ
jgi:hypothetical protein